MRTLLNVLAVIIGLASGVMALMGCAAFAMLLFGLFEGNKEILTNAGGWLGIAVSAFAVVIGGVIASRAWLHLLVARSGR